MKPLRNRVTQAIRTRQHTAGFRSYRFRLGYRFGTVIVAIGLATILSLVVEFSGQKPLKAEEKRFLERYELIRSKLAHDDLAGAKVESSVLVRSLPSDIATAAQSIADSDTLESARLGFAALSRRAVSIAHNREGYFVIYCPTTGCPQQCASCPMSRFSDWVQTNPAVENPFLGADQTRSARRLVYTNKMFGALIFAHGALNCPARVTPPSRAYLIAFKETSRVYETGVQDPQ